MTYRGCNPLAGEDSVLQKNSGHKGPTMVGSDLDHEGEVDIVRGAIQEMEGTQVAVDSMDLGAGATMMEGSSSESQLHHQSTR